jgi:cell division protein FtsW
MSIGGTGLDGIVSELATPGRAVGNGWTMARKLKSDKVLFFATLLLVFAGIVMVYSASAMMAMERFHRPYLFLIKQSMWAALGIAALGIVMRVDYRVYRQPAVIWTSLAVVGAGLCLVLLSTPINGTRRWFGFGGFGVQPSELAKLALILFTAALLERRMHRVNDVRYALLPIALVTGAVVLLVLLEPDFGTAVSMLIVVALMVFAAGLDWRYFAVSAGVAIPVLATIAIAEPYRMRRLTSFLNPEADPLNQGFQILQSLIAVGTGGLTGAGLMQGVQKLFYLPEPHTDFIYAVIGEELGLLGTTLVLIAFIVITWRGLRVALQSPDPFASFLAMGLTGMIAVQAFINISVVLALMPTKGIPLPFVSAGGSSLLINLVGMGILLNLSQHASPVGGDEA